MDLIILEGVFWLKVAQPRKPTLFEGDVAAAFNTYNRVDDNQLCSSTSLLFAARAGHASIFITVRNVLNASFVDPR